MQFHVDFDHIRTIGYLPGSVQIPGGKPNVVMDQDYLNYDPDLSKIPCPITHAYMFNSWTGAQKQVKLFDHPATMEDDVAGLLPWATEQYCAYLDSIGVSWVEKDFEEIEWNMKAATGFGHEEKKKEIYLERNRPEINLYWERAHIDNAVVLWKMAQKEEFLPFKKVYDDDQRCFEIPDVLFLTYACRLTQPFNDSLSSRWRESNIKVGMEFANGQFDAFWKSLRGILGTFDVKKWDKFFESRLRMCCLEARLHTYRGKLKDIRKRMEFIYKNCTKAYLVLPWLQVILILLGMLSGDPSTSYDNSSGMQILALCFVKYYMPEVSSWREAFSHFRLFNYSDDGVFRSPFNSVGRFFAAWETRVAFWSRAGFNLKPEDDVVHLDGDPIGLTFLGAKVVSFPPEGHAYYAPQYNLGRIWSALVQDPVGLSKFDKYQKSMSLLLLSTFSGEEQYNLVREYVLYLVRSFDAQGLDWFLMTPAEHAMTSVPPIIPVWKAAVAWWLGFETSLVDHLGWCDLLKGVDLSPFHAYY